MRKALLPFVWLLGWSLLAIWSWQPPLPEGPDAPDSVFSAARAMRHVRRMAAQPHPIGTIAHDEVRDYLTEQMDSLGLEVLWEASTVRHHDVYDYFAHVENVAGLLRGSEGGPSIVLAAHYDSQFNTGGAGDNAASCAALLETARALRASALRPKRDILFVFTDGEEYGLHGARAFVQSVLRRQVGLLFNFEARGHKGPSLLFETSPANDALIEAYARSEADALTSSLFYEVYRFLPNDTDMTIFKEDGISGLNFAFLGGLAYYHSPADRSDLLSEASLQHHGQQALSLVLHFGQLSLPLPAEANRVYFSVWRGWLWHYPEWCAWVVAFLACGLAGWVIARQRHHLRPKDLVIGLLAGLVWPVTGGLAGWLLFQGLYALVPGYRTNLMEGVYHVEWYYASFGLMMWWIWWWQARLLTARYSLQSLWTGAMLWWILLTLLTTALVPGASYLFAWPLLCIAAGEWMVWRIPVWSARLAGHPWQRYAQPLLRFPHRARLLTWVPVIWMLAPITWLLMEVLSLWAMAAPLLLLMLWLPLGWPTFVLSFRYPVWHRVMGGIAVFCGLVGLGLGFHHTADTPYQSHLSYYWDADEQKAFWVSKLADLDPWNSQWLAEATPQPISRFYPQSSRQYLTAKADAVPMPAVYLSVLRDTVVADTTQAGQSWRILDLQYVEDTVGQDFGPPVHAVFQLARHPAHHRLFLDGLAAEWSDKHPWIRCFFHGLPAARPVPMRLITRPGAPVEFVILTQHRGLPIHTPMPAHIVHGASYEANMSTSKKRFVF